MVTYSLSYDSTQTNHLIQWNIVFLSKGNYRFKIHGYSSYATSEHIAKADVGHNIVGGDHQQQWKILDLEEPVPHMCAYTYVILVLVGLLDQFSW